VTVAAELRVAHSADLDAATRRAARALLELACDWREGDAW
jgi:hypothetical protein